MKRLMTVAGYTAAALTIVAAILAPFVLMNWVLSGISALGLRVDPVYSGGETARTITKAGYRIAVNRPVVPKKLLPGVPAFVQVAWEPASALPARIADEVDIDDDGRPDMLATFAVPADPNSELRADVTSLSPRVASTRGIARQSFACVFVRVGDRLVLRVPLSADSRR